MRALTAARLGTMLGNWRGHGPGYRDLADAIRVLVVNAQVPQGTRLPSERLLAEAIDVSRTTTARAYEELRERGFLTSRRGSGSTISLPLSETSASALLGPAAARGDIALTDAAGQAVPGLGGAFERALDRLPGLLSTTGYLPDGYEPLRERIAARYAAEGLDTDPSQIIVTSGAQGALAIIASTLVTRGDRVLVEACGFPHAFDSFSAAGGRLLPLPHGDTPWDTEDVRQAAGAADLAYLNIDFHNPTGCLMPEAQRADIARALQRSGVVTVCDETLRETGWEGEPLPPHYASFHPDAITIGSFSKSIWGGLRLGWIRAPHHLVTRFVQTRVRMDLGSAAFEQVVATEALDSGLDGTHAGGLRAQRDALVDALRASLPTFEVEPPAGGLSLWVTLPRPVSSRLVAAAQQQSLRLLPGGRFFAAPGSIGERYLRLPFTQPEEVAAEAVARLKRAWQTIEHGAPAATEPPRRDVDLIA